MSKEMEITNIVQKLMAATVEIVLDPRNTDEAKWKHETVKVGSEAIMALMKVE